MLGLYGLSWRMGQQCNLLHLLLLFKVLVSQVSSLMYSFCREMGVLFMPFMQYIQQFLALKGLCRQ